MDVSLKGMKQIGNWSAYGFAAGLGFALFRTYLSSDPDYKQLVPHKKYVVKHPVIFAQLVNLQKFRSVDEKLFSKLVDLSDQFLHLMTFFQCHPTEIEDKDNDKILSIFMNIKKILETMKKKLKKGPQDYYVEFFNIYSILFNKFQECMDGVSF
jgi:hypothetical protein